MSSTNNLKVKSLDSIGQYGALEFRRVFPLSCSNETLIDAFIAACGHNDFVITQRTNDKATAIKELHNMFGCVLPGLPMFGPMSSRDVVVNLAITAQDKHGYKLLTVVGPKRPAMQTFVRALEHELSSASHFWVSKFSDSVRKDFKVSFQESLDDSPVFHSIPESGNQSYKTEEAAYYYFYKMLSNRRYHLGADLAQFESDFNSQFPPITSSSGDASPLDSLSGFSHLPLPNWSPSESSHKLLGKIDEIAFQLDKGFSSLQNPSSALGEDLLPRMPACVERIVFESVGRSLWLHYRVAFAEDDAAFVVKAAAIRLASGANLASACGVRDLFRFSFTRSVALMNALQGKAGSATPNTLLQALLSILISVKTEVLTGTFGERELESMDDIAPIFLLILLSAEEIKSPNALYHMLLDTMRTEQRMETEGRTVALLEGATRLVMHDWAPAVGPGPAASPTAQAVNTSPVANTIGKGIASARSETSPKSESPDLL